MLKTQFSLHLTKNHKEPRTTYLMLSMDQDVRQMSLHKGAPKDSVLPSIQLLQLWRIEHVYENEVAEVRPDPEQVTSLGF